jgi:hypothetical protein
MPYLSTGHRGKLLVRFHSTLGKWPRPSGRMSRPWKKMMLPLIRSHTRNQKRVWRAMVTVRHCRIFIMAKALLPFHRYSLKAFLMACKLGKPMRHLSRIGRVPPALLGKSSHTMK